jgi:hypothetical protein
MKYKVCFVLSLYLLVSLLAEPVSAVDNVNAKFVTNVRDIQDYDLHWNDRFPPNSTLKLYIEAQDVSHKRIIALDYLVLITDTEGIFVDGSFVGKRYFLFPGKTNYTTNDYIVYSKNIPDEWIDGVYTADIYVFDLTNDSKANNALNVVKNNFINSVFAFVEKNASENVTTTYETGTTYAPITTESISWYPSEWNSDLADLILINRTAAPFIHITRHFFVDRHASKYPPDWFHIEDVRLDRQDAAPEELINVSVNVTNTYFEAGKTGFSVNIDDTVVQSVNVSLNATETKTLNFSISNATVGEHILSIVPTSPKTLSLALDMPFTISAREISTPPTMVVTDLQIDKLKILAGEQVTITLVVKNIGRNGTAPVSIKVNDDVLTLNATANISMTTEVLFNLTPMDEGDYRVEVPGTEFAKLFFVGESLPEETPSPVVEKLEEKVEEKKPQLRVILLLSVIIVLLYVLRTYLRWKTY